MVLTGDLGFNLFDKFCEKYPSQFVNVGVAEQNMVGVASGLALEGKKVIAYSIGNFPTLRCLEQIRNDACYHELNLTITAFGGGFSYGQLGMSHHATEDLSILRAIPQATIMVPATEWEVSQSIKALFNNKGFGYLRLEKTLVEEKCPEFDNFAIGKAYQLRQGDDITLVAAGGIANEVLMAANQLPKDGIQCRVLSISTLKPVDVDEITRACKETGGIVTIEENNLIGGLGSCVAEVCMDQGLNPNYFQRIGLKDQYSSVVGSQKYLRSFHGLDSNAITSCVNKLLREN
jgi:transketolase